MTESTAMASQYKIIILAPNWLGDAIMMTPLLSFLNDGINYPDGVRPHITLAIRQAWAPLFASDNRIDHVLPLDREGSGGLKGVVSLTKKLKQGTYDAALLGPPSLRVGIAAWLAKIPRRLGYASDGRSPLLTTVLKKHPRGISHYSDEMLALGQSLVGDDTPLHSNLLTSLPGCTDVSVVNTGEGPPIWVMAPGTTYGQAKTWPGNHVAKFIDQAVLSKGVRVLLLGDKQTRSFVANLEATCSATWRSQLPGPAGIIDMTGKTDLLQVVALLKSASAFVGNDSGLMHLAGALGVPTVGLFGSSNPDWTAPLGKKTRALAVEGFPCRPCYRKTCNHHEFCLEKLDPSDVIAAVSELLMEKI